MDDLELVRPLSGADWWNVPASGDVPAIEVTDGPAGARGERFAGGPPSVSFPCGAAMGATWDVELIGRVGAALAEETKAKGAEVLLGPTGAYLDTPPEPGVLRYQEGVHVGHRWYDLRGIEPAFPFGHGLSYTSWSIGPPTVRGLDVEVDVANTGDRPGTEVVQLYLGHPGAPVRRPVRSLAAFAKVALGPGGSAAVRFSLAERDLARWDPAAHTWVADAGEHLVWVGRSSRDLGEPATLTLTETWRGGP